MSKEKELKFLVLGPTPYTAKLPKESIEQAYVSIDPNGTEVRVRRLERAYFLTVKSGGDITRDEYEAEINRTSFLELRKLSSSRIVTKTRYYFSKDRLHSLDVYKGRLEGLAIVELEGGQSTPRSMLLKEVLSNAVDVTLDVFFKNKNLTSVDFTQVSRHVARQYSLELYLPDDKS